MFHWVMCVRTRNTDSILANAVLHYVYLRNTERDTKRYREKYHRQEQQWCLQNSWHLSYTETLMAPTNHTHLLH